MYKKQKHPGLCQHISSHLRQKVHNDVYQVHAEVSHFVQLAVGAVDVSRDLVNQSHFQIPVMKYVGELLSVHDVFFLRTVLEWVEVISLRENNEKQESVW